jgi:ASCH domain
MTRSLIKVLTIRQPWAALIISGHKPIENRSWVSDYRGRLYIHAGLNYDVDAFERIEREHDIQFDRATLQKGAIIGHAEMVDCVTAHPSRWFDGPYGWVLRNPKRIAAIPLKGQLGLFSIDADLLTKRPARQRRP